MIAIFSECWQPLRMFWQRRQARPLLLEDTGVGVTTAVNVIFELKKRFYFSNCDLLSINPKKILLFSILFCLWYGQLFSRSLTAAICIGLTSFIYQKWAILFINDFAQFDASLSFYIEKISFDTY